MVKYIPKQGDIIELDSTKGHEQKGHRPAIVISSFVFNSFTNMAIVCPITSNTKEFPTHYNLKETKKINGSVLCEHLKSIDYNARKIKFIEESSDNDFLNVYFLLISCFEEKEFIKNAIQI